MPYLLVSKELRGYQVFRFSTGVSIGRAQNNDIVFDGPEDLAISRHHALVQQEGSVFVLYDRSKNGTFINNDPIDHQVLTHGTTFQITDYSFTFIDDSAARSIEAAKGKDAKAVEKEQGLETLVIRGVTGAVGSREAAALKRQLAEEGVIIASEAMVNLYRDVRAVAGINVPVLILGEPGCGKEHVAHALHHYSGARGNFIALNCSSIPEGLFESELFGCVKGAFNNAIDKPGKLELAKNGTIFLDEIGDMNPALQPKLLRFMEDMEITRLGDTKVKRVRVRVVAATNQDLHAMMEQGSFREDFYQRLACIKLEIPPLRDRLEEIAPLAEFFVNRFSKEYRCKPARISPSAMKLLQGYPWPGNVRELKNVLLNVLVHVQGKTVYPSHLIAVCPGLGSKGAKSTEAFPSMQEMEKRHIVEALERSRWNKAEAARLLQISRDTLYNKIRKFGIEES